VVGRGNTHGLNQKIEQKELLINFGSLKTASKYGIFTAG
jgi:hypothetical protein